MPYAREPLLRTVAIADLRPTQMTVGLREVEAKRKEWRKRHGAEKAAFLGAHMIPVLLGPDGRNYVIDHHHLARALLEEEVETVALTTVADLRHLETDEFWSVCDHRGWVYPYDAEGVRHPYEDLPKKVAKMADDPFRSLAGELRVMGGYAKDTAPYSEFMWADFLRRRIKRTRLDKDFAASLKEAYGLARAPAAGYLPGWCGPVTGGV